MFKKNFIIIISIALIIISIFIAINTKKSFVDNTEYNEKQIENYTVEIDTKNANEYDNDIKNLDDLLSKSNIVAKVKVLGNRKIQSKTILSKVRIIDIFKGDRGLINKEIGVYEPAFPEQRNNTLISDNGYIPMSNNDEYVLFLKHIIPSEVYDKNENYMFVSNKYGKYGLNQSEDLNNKTEIKFNEIKGYNNIIIDKNDSEIFNNIKHEILEEIKN